MTLEGEHLATPLLDNSNTSNEGFKINLPFLGNKIETEESVEKNESSGEKGFHAFTSVCFTVNFIVGTGFLTLPWAFVQGGLILSTILLILASGICDIIKDFTLEAMARAEAVVPISESIKEDIKENSVESEQNVQQEEDTNDDETALLVKERKFEMSDLTRIFLGEKGGFMWTALLSISIFMTLWAYTVVFITVLLDLFSSTSNKDVDTMLYTGLFAILVVPLSCMELKEQVSVQVVLACCRLLMLVSMVSTTILFPEEFHSSDESYKPPTYFNFSGVYRCLPIILFALGFQPVIPGISKETNDKRELGKIFTFTFFLCAFCYIFVGLSVAMAAGQSIPQSSNVMWKKFHGGTGELNEDGEWINVAIWAKAVSYFVVIFPALDVLSAFPLQAICLASNLLDAVFRDATQETKVNKSKPIPRVPILYIFYGIV